MTRHTPTALALCAVLASAARGDSPPPGEAAALGGEVGLARTPFAMTGGAGSVRVAAHATVYAGSYPDPTAVDRQWFGEFAVGYTPLKQLELFLAYRNTSNYNAKADPQLVQVEGDLEVGAKGAFDLGHGVSVGADLRIAPHNGVGSDVVDFSATTYAVRALFSYAGRVRAHAAIGAALGTLNALTDPANAIPAASQFGVGLSGYNRFIAGVAVEVPVGKIAVPFLELSTDVPLGVASSALGGQSLYAVSATRITPGLRLNLGEISTLDLGIEIGGSAGTPIAGFSPAAPYTVFAGYTFHFLPSLYNRPPPPAPVVERALPAITPMAPPPPMPVMPQIPMKEKAKTGKLVGTVTDAVGNPVAGAVVALGVGLPPVATDGLGTFVGFELPPGPLHVSATKTGYRAAEATTSVVAAQDTRVSLKLVAEPPSSTVIGLAKADGKPIAARIQLRGPAMKELFASAAGTFDATLTAGTYSVVASAPGYLAAAQQANAAPNGHVLVALDLKKRAAKPAVSIVGDAVKLVKPWKLDDKKLDPPKDAAQALDELTDYLLTHPEQKLKILASSDPQGTPEATKALTQRRADALKAALVQRGAPADSVEAVGDGADHPIAPNVTKSGREKNRRLGLTLTKATVEVPKPPETTKEDWTPAPVAPLPAAAPDPSAKSDVPLEPLPSFDTPKSDEHKKGVKPPPAPDNYGPKG